MVATLSQIDLPAESVHLRQQFVGEYAVTDDVVLTDLRDVWLCRRSLKDLLVDKERFNKTLQVKEEELLELLRSRLAIFDEKGRYSFRQAKNSKDLTWEVRVPLAIYNFMWEFAMDHLPDFNVRRMILEDMVMPMVGALAAQEDRCAILEARLPVSDRLTAPNDW